MQRFALRDDQWDRIKECCRAVKAMSAVTAADNRLFVEAVLIDIEQGSLGVICPRVSAIGRSCQNVGPEALIGDKAYDANSFVDTLIQREITPVIPPKVHRTTQRACDFHRLLT